jgi:hypothetical protein
VSADVSVVAVAAMTVVMVVVLVRVVSARYVATVAVPIVGGCGGVREEVVAMVVVVRVVSARCVATVAVPIAGGCGGVWVLLVCEVVVGVVVEEEEEEEEEEEGVVVVVVSVVVVSVAVRIPQFGPVHSLEQSQVSPTHSPGAVIYLCCVCMCAWGGGGKTRTHWERWFKKGGREEGKASTHHSRCIFRSCKQSNQFHTGLHHILPCIGT